MAETAVRPTDVRSSPLLQDLPRKEQKQRNRGFFSLFRRRKKKHNEQGSVSAPVSPGFSKRLEVGVKSSANTLPADMPKKRRAPQPPVGSSQSVPNSLGSRHVKGGQRSAESTLRSTKRRAPPPPCVPTPDPDVRVESLKPLGELRETDGSPESSQPSFPSRSSLDHLHEVANPFLPSFRGRDLSDARCALAKVLTSSLSNGVLVKRLKNSAANFYVSSCMSTTPDRPDDGDFRVEHESILKSDLPTENEWDDPIQRSGLTTFKVVPPRKPASCESEQGEAVPAEDGPVAEGPSEAENDTRTEEGLHSPSRSESPELDSQQNQMKDISSSSTPLHDDDQNSSGTTENQEEEEVPSEVAQNETSDCGEEESTSDHQLSPSSDEEPCPSYADDDKAEEDPVRDEEKEEDINFPPPPPPTYFKEDTEVSETEREPSTNSTPSRFQPVNPVNRHPDAPGEAQEDRSEPSQDRANEGPSRFAQAVATAVQRSRLQSLGEDVGPRVSSGPRGTLPSPPRSTYQCAPPPTLARWSDSIQL